jgi:IS30 family transposase
LPSKTAAATAVTLCGTFATLPEAARRSVTFDNGPEVARHQKLQEDLTMQSSFCDPQSPWQRGSLENANGLLRRDLPRKPELSSYSDQDIHDIVWAINTTPRKCLDFLSPAEAFIHQLRCCT